MYKLAHISILLKHVQEEKAYYSSWKKALHILLSSLSTPFHQTYSHFSQFPQQKTLMEIKNHRGLYKKDVYNFFTVYISYVTVPNQKWE